MADLLTSKRAKPETRSRTRARRGSDLEPETVERLQDEIGNKATIELISRLADAGVISGPGMARGLSAHDLLAGPSDEREREEPQPDHSPPDVDRSAIGRELDPPDDAGGNGDGGSPAAAPSDPPPGADASDGGTDPGSASGSAAPPADGSHPTEGVGLDRRTAAPQPSPAVHRDGAHAPNGLSIEPYRARPVGPTVQRWELPDVSLPDLPVPDIGDVVALIPGYDLLTVIIGFDPVTGRRVEPSPERLVRALIGLAPGGAAIYDELQRSGVLQPAFELIDRELEGSNLTAERFSNMLDTAWNEVDLTPRFGIIDENVAVVSRHIGQLTDDVESFASSLSDAVIEIIKNAALDEIERLLAADPQANATWELTKAVLHHDPLRDARVEATTEQIIEQFLILIGRETELEQMRERGTLAETAAWLDTQLATFESILGEFSSLVDSALDALSPSQLPDLADNLVSLVERGVGLIQRVGAFAVTVAEKVLDLIKDSLLEMLSEHAKSVPGFDLVSVLIGQNPFTGQAVARTPENIIKGFITLLPGGAEQYEQLSETGVIPAAAAKIEAAIEALGISWEFISGLFEDIWNSFSIDDLLDPFGAFERVMARFEEPIGRLFEFVSTVMQSVFELVLELMGFPTDLLQRIIANAMAAFEDIQADPIGFFENMLSALRLGFSTFFDNIGDHLLGGLTEWLLGGLEGAGITIPEELTFESILGLVFDVLGLGLDTLWEKLAERLPEGAVERLQQGVEFIGQVAGQAGEVWNFITDVQERGLVAIWEMIESKISMLWDTILERAQDWIVTRVIEGVVTKLLSMLDPTGIMAVVNSFIAFFNAIESAIEYFREILEIVDRYVATIAEIAQGAIEGGAQQLEAGLAQSIPVAIGFLANQVGLGDIAAEIRKIIEGIREVVDEALDWFLDRAVELGASALGALGLGGAGDGEEAPAEGTDAAAEAEAASAEAAAAGVDPADHDAVATHAVGRLRAAPIRDDLPPLAATAAVARTLEPALSRMLAQGIGLRFEFLGGEDDAEDGEIEFQVVIAPNTTTKPGTKEVEDDDKGHARDDSGVLVGLDGTYGSLSGRQDPRSTKEGNEHLKLYAEHVLPRIVVDRIARAMGLPGSARTSSWYTQAPTILLYIGAKGQKDAGDPDSDDMARQTAESAATLSDPTTPVDKREEALQHLYDVLDSATTDAVLRTQAAVGAEHRANKDKRGTPDQVPTDDKIRAVAGQERALAEQLLKDGARQVRQTEDRSGAAFPPVAAEEVYWATGGRAEMQRDTREDKWALLKYALSASHTVGDVTKTRSRRVDVRFSIDYADVVWAMSGSGVAERGVYRPGQTGPIVAQLDAVRATLADEAKAAAQAEASGTGATATERGFGAAYRSDAVAKYDAATGDTQMAKATKALESLPEHPQHGKPAAGTIIGWWRETATATGEDES